ncbi:MAG: 4-hydroxythreonine-4-phosphate dehydrogenase PdxA [Steroidobacteraceae bacterium]
MARLPRIALTSGEPAGIGPELCAAVARTAWPCELVCLGDRALLAERAAATGGGLILHDYRRAEARAHVPGELRVAHAPLAAPSDPGRLDPRNASYVLALLDAAMSGAVTHEFDAIVTAPVQKSLINEAGIAFTGHTEYLAAHSGIARPVMLLVAGGLRVALATTHLPLRAVSAAITAALLQEVLDVLATDLARLFGLARPRILVCGVNPHAGESGHLGREEIEVIAPALEAARARGLEITGPVPADTAFVPARLADFDAVLAMYHDQGLPVLKHAGFGRAVNVTLGLPFIRTSVDHGTALELAGTGRADAGSLEAALALAIEMAGRRH